MVQKQTETRGILLAGTTALFWGFLPIFLKIALTFADVMTIVWFRFTTAALALLLYYSIRNPSTIKTLFRPPWILVFASFMLAGNYFRYNKGLELTTPSNAQVLIQSSPLMFAIAGILFFKERLTRLQICGIVIAVTGFSIFYRDQLSNLMTDQEEYHKGNLWMLFAAIVWVFYAVSNKLMIGKLRSQQINLCIYTISSLIFIPFVDFSLFTNMSLKQWLLMLFLGANTLIAYGTLAESFKLIPAYKIGIIVSLNPIITLAVMAMLTWQQVTWIQHENAGIYGYAGAALVVTGAVLVALRKAPLK